jgi:hypothetical protein
MRERLVVDVRRWFIVYLRERLVVDGPELLRQVQVVEAGYLFGAKPLCEVEHYVLGINPVLQEELCLLGCKLIVGLLLVQVQYLVLLLVLGSRSAAVAAGSVAGSTATAAHTVLDRLLLLVWVLDRLLLEGIGRL